MAKGQKAVPVDQYIYDLLSKAVEEHKANGLADAIHRSICLFMSVPYTPIADIRAERKIKEQVDLFQNIEDVRRTSIQSTPPPEF